VDLFMELIKVEDLFKTYHIGEIDVPALQGVSFSIARGEMVALMGVSGSGKTTLMNILGCLDHPTSGKYWFDGEEMSDLSPNERAMVRTTKIGFVFQNFNLLPRTTALHNVSMPLDYAAYRSSNGEARQWASYILERVGLADRADHEPSQMSGGQQQRVAIARALVNHPALVLADEPTGNLDSHTSVEILRMFQQLNAEGITVILVTHDPNVAAYAHRTIHITDGQIDSDKIHVSDAQEEDSNGNGDSGPVPIVQVAGPHFRTGDGSKTVVSTATLVHKPARQPAVKASPKALQPVQVEPMLKPRRRLIPSLMPHTFITAMNAIRRNIMRSALTALGVVIGVGAVIAMMEIGHGSKTALLKTIANMGANNLWVQAGTAASGGVTFGSGSVMTLTAEDAEEIARQCPAVAEVAIIVRARTQVIYGNRNWVPMQISGTTPSFLVVRDWEDFDEGDMFTDRDVINGSLVCVIGQTLKRELFQGESAVGKEIRLKNVPFRIIGVLSRKGTNMMGFDQDDVILAPWTTIKNRVSGTMLTNVNQSAAAAAGAGGATATVNTLDNLYPGSTALYIAPSAIEQANTPQVVRFANVDQIMVRAVSSEEMQQAIEQITTLLRERHRIRPGESDDFNTRDMTELTRTMSQQSQRMAGLLLAVALISLLVGGVGIMNIMLVSVTERTREIGLRMAVGARSYHILRQFLVEAVVLCLFGGVMGILLGRGASILVRTFIRWPTEISLPAIIAAFIVSVTVGIVFGFYPAWKASRLDPIEALRYE